MYVFAIAAAFVLAACSETEPEEEPREPPRSRESQPDLPEDVSYQRKCIGPEKCSRREESAAVTEYVGAVYGEEGKVRYDGNLTGREQVYIEQQFGKYRSGDDIDSKMRLLRQNFLSQHPSSLPQDACKPELFRSNQRYNKQWGFAFDLGGFHDCGELFTDAYFKSRAEFTIASEPEQWIFFIEKGEEAGPQEYSYFHRIAQRLNIPIHDPVISIRSKAVIEEAARELNSTYEEIAAYQTFDQLKQGALRAGELPLDYNPEGEAEAHFYATQTRMFFSEVPAARQGLKPLAKMLSIHPEVLKNSCRRYLIGPQGAYSAVHFWERLLNDSNRIVPALVRASNRLSVPHVKDLLRKEGRRKAFFQMGTFHLPITLEIYGPHLDGPRP